MNISPEFINGELCMELNAILGYIDKITIDINSEYKIYTIKNNLFHQFTCWKLFISNNLGIIQHMAFFFLGDKVIPLYAPQCGKCKFCLTPRTNFCGKLK